MAVNAKVPQGCIISTGLYFCNFGYTDDKTVMEWYEPSPSLIKVRMKGCSRACLLHTSGSL